MVRACGLQRVDQRQQLRGMIGRLRGGGASWHTGHRNSSGVTDWEYWFLGYMALYLLIYNGWGCVIMNEVGE